MARKPAHPQLMDVESVPGKELDQPEYTYVASVDFSRPVSKTNKLIRQICILISALLNAVGGILKLTSQPGTPCDSKTLDQWQINITQRLSTFIPERRNLVTIQLVRAPGPVPHLCVFVRKSVDFITFDSFMFMSDGPQRTRVTETAVISRIIRQGAAASTLVLPINNGCVKYGQIMPDEAENLEYKCWNVKQKLRQNKKRNTTPQTAMGIYKELINKEASGALFALPNRRGGGKLIIGVDEHDQHMPRVKGQELSKDDEKKLTVFIGDFLTRDPETNARRIWGEEGVSPKRGTHWDVEYVQVDGTPFAGRLILIVIELYHCASGVFKKCPESYIVDMDGMVRCLVFSEWLAKCLEHSESPANNAGKRTSMKNELFSYESGVEYYSDDDSFPALNTEIIDRNMQKEALFSWTDYNENWRGGIKTSSRRLDANVMDLASNSKMFNVENPINFTPDESIIIEATPGIEPALRKMKAHHVQGGCAFVCLQMHHCFPNPDIPIVRNHVLDALILQEDGLHFWVVAEADDDQAAYLWLSGRTIKRYIVEFLHRQLRTRSISIRLHCYLYILDEGRIVQESEPVYELSGAGVSINELKLAIAHCLICGNTRMKTILGEEISLQMTAQQYGAIVGIDFPRVVFVVGPPGTGKSVIGIHMCRYFGREASVYMVGNAEFKAFIDFQDICHTVLIRNEYDLQRQIDGGKVPTAGCIIFDDVQTLCFNRHVWHHLLMYTKIHKKVHLLFLCDPKVQAYLPGQRASALITQVEEFCRREKIAYDRRTLSHVHRNSKKVTSYLHNCMDQCEALTCTSPLEGDAVETLVMSGTLDDTDGNPLVAYIRRLTRPKDLLDLSLQSSAYSYKDILIMVAESAYVEAAIFRLRNLLRRRLGESSVQTPLTYPVTGIRVGAVGDFHGLESPVCICLANEGSVVPQVTTHANQVPENSGKSKSRSESTPTLFNPKYRAFVSSRAVSRLVYITEQMNYNLAVSLGYKDLSRFQRSDSLDQEIATNNSEVLHKAKPTSNATEEDLYEYIEERYPSVSGIVYQDLDHPSKYQNGNQNSGRLERKSGFIRRNSVKTKDSPPPPPTPNYSALNDMQI